MNGFLVPPTNAPPLLPWSRGIVRAVRGEAFNRTRIVLEPTSSKNYGMKQLPSVGVNQAMFDGILYQLSDGVQIQGLHGTVAMEFYGPRRNP